ncbi:MULTISPECIES: hypothetical protein [unclassified Mesorhizobium]|uniref:hypothetical protein n=1 Tax=unclassified Mesorhizobium TaxID=325217 RepID=UPI0013EE2D73|nr:MULTISPECIES: hypothetical protein [unclassified Mesorhizobium]
MKRATQIDSALPPGFDPVPARVRWSEAQAAAWSPLRHHKGWAKNLSSEGQPCAS